MAQKKFELKFDIDAGDVEIVSDKMLTLTEKARILKKELQKDDKTPEQFEILSAKLGDMEDNMARTTARSKDLFTSLQLIPGPIGQISSQINGTIALMKTFSGFKLEDLKFQFKETINDIKEVGSWLGKTTGITTVFEKTAGLLEGTFKRFGMSADNAAKAARGWGAALTGIGIGALIFGIYKLIDAYNSLNAEQELTNQLAEQSAQIAGKQISTLIQLDNTLKQTTLTDRQKDEAVKQYNSTLGDTLGKVENWIELEKKLIDKLPDYKAYLLKRAEAEATSMLITKAISDKIQTEMTDPASMAGFYDVWSEGGILGFFIEGKTGIGQNIQKRALTAADKTIAGLQSRLMKTNEEIAAQQKQLGLDKPAPKEDKKTQGKTPEQMAAERLAKQKEALAASIKLEIDSENTRESVLRPLIEKRDKMEFDEIDKAKQIALQQYRNKEISLEQYNNLIAGAEAKRLLIQQNSNKEIKNALEEDKKVEEQKIKNQEEFQRKIRDLKTSAIVDDVEREKQARTDKYNDDLIDLERNVEFIKLSEERKNEVRKTLKETYDRDIAKIGENARKKELDDEKKSLEDRLKLLELQGQGLLAGTKAYYDNRKAILDESLRKELIGVEKGSAEELAIRQKYNNLYKQLDEEKLASQAKVLSATFDALGGLTAALASSYDEEAKTSERAFNKRKSLQKATALMSAASGIIQILTQPSTLPSPFDWIVKGINAAALAVTTAVNIKKIEQTKFEAPAGDGGTSAQPYRVTANRAAGGIVTGEGTSTSDSIPARLSNGEFVVNARATSAFLPLLNAINDAGRQPRFAMGGLYKEATMGYDVADNISSAISTSLTSQPIKTYVVSQDMSNSQQFDRQRKSRSTI